MNRPQSTGRQRSSGTHLRLLFATLVLFLGAAEAVLWLLGLPEKHRPHSHPPQFWAFPDTDYLYLNLPSSRIRFVYDGDPRGYFGPGKQVDHHTNSLGFRGGEFSQ